MSRFHSVALVLLALVGTPALAVDSAEAAVAEIERLAVAAHWRDAEAKIAALASRPGALTATQRQRVEYVRLRNLALAGEQSVALDGLSELLRRELPASLRVRVYTTAVSIAANLENWTAAFALLGEGLPYLSQAPAEAPGLLGAASYLHTLVGEHAKARELALNALAAVESGTDPRAVCMAVTDVAIVEDHAGNIEESTAWRHRQIEACTRAGDVVFIANGKYGVGKMLARQGRHAEALDWSRQALADFEAAGFAAGAWSARLGVAEGLIEANRGLGEAEALLGDTLDYYSAQEAHLAIAETEGLTARLAERRGDAAQALAHYRRSMDASKAAERDARERRLAFLQVEFDTRLKEQQIALLEAEKELAALQVTATQRRQWLLAGGMAGLLVTAILLFGLLRRSMRERRRYRWQSEHDGLTRLYNYQQVRKLGAKAFARARGDGRPFTAIVADIDMFKQVNDRYGHAAGDEALRSLGAWITDIVGTQGIAGRSGGDEFTILLEADAAAAEALMGQLRGRIEPITVFGQRFEFKVSAGICQDDGETASLEQLIHRADRALYRAKHDGRDRVVLAGTAAVAGARAAAGSLVVVGSGIQFGRHASERCLSEIREAEVVFCLVDPFALGMIQRFRPDAINLGAHYAPGKDRRQTYREIDAAIMAEVDAGRHVCAVFYGHPGVFADVPHLVLDKARARGIAARMEPGISAEACLYADLGIDPGKRGVQSMEATHFMVYDRQPDSAGLVLLWQVALSGDLSCRRLHAERDGLQALVDKLLRWYPADHDVILYEAAQLPIASPRIERLALQDLPAARYEEYTTLVIPALGELREDPLRAVG
ncbi:diguanylate cyclase [Luteimonas sp. MC1825]|uniref:diguanylate cyclase n=1 Tax=Luteimonas sp. MC1825 TaxID=2761107 RepID=UPI001614D890|nr:diguanylate cyclase [Luteimonas sp. MC1825]MBB6599546.1 diguanylate cyclase [Luteimonas sp. MC1825]QOC87239.1 diguanylate cyclase [Luteimonas sp. MC1825]